jgi:N-acetylmuramoyl-L-alanine amidase
MYRTQFYHGRARECQVQANIDNCTAYVQACFNKSENPKDNYTSVAIASNALEITRRWAKKYAQLVSDDFDTPLGGKEGILIGGAYGENELDLIYTRMPAILVKPLFATNPLHADWIKSKAGQLRLARTLSASILCLFPNGGLIGFCLCATNEYENNTDSYADMVLRQAAIMLQSNKTSFTSPLYKEVGV